MARLAPLRLILVLAAATLAACFDYSEQLTISHTGAVRADVRYVIPDWLPPHEGRPARSLTPDARSLRARYPQAEIKLGDNNRTEGFSGTFADVSELDSPFVGHQVDWLSGGRWRFSVRIKVPPSFADAVSREAERQVRRIPLLSPERKAAMARRAPEQFGFRFAVSLPGEITASNGELDGSTLVWKVPLADLRGDNEIRLFAEGRLTFWQRIKRFFSRGLGR